MIRRLRPLPPADVLALMYPRPHDHRLYGRGHDERVETTIALAARYVQATTWGDLSCGNGEIVRRLCPQESNRHLGDFAGPVARGHEHGYVGPIERTLVSLPHVSAFVLSETLEHLDDPDDVLKEIRFNADDLVLTTPLECWEDTNAEHLWAWDREGVETLLTGAGWTPTAFDQVDSRAYGEPYLYGIWVCQ